MSVIPESFMEPLQWFSEQLRSDLQADSPEDANLVTKGMHLYRQGAVKNIKLEQDAITATVQDVMVVKVKLDLNIPHLSECSCPAEGYCRHVMAVFFQLLSYESSVSQWVEEWRQPLKDVKAAKSWGMAKAKDLLKAAGLLKPDYTMWTTTFRESFDEIMSGNGDPNPYLIPELFEVYSRRMRAGAPMKREWRNLYLLIGSVVSFVKLIELSRDLGHNENQVNRHYRHLFQNIMDDVTELSQTMAVQSMPFAFDEFIEKLKDESIALLHTDYTIEFDRTYFYCLLWTRLFKKKNWREEQVELLACLPEKSFPVTLALIHLNTMLRNDDTAHSLIKTCGPEITPYFFYWLELMETGKDWQRMEPYIVEFVARLRPYLSGLDDFYKCRDFMRMALSEMITFCGEAGRLDLFEKALLEMLPYSFHEYDEFLFEKKDFEKWLDLQTYLGGNVGSLSSSQIKILQIENPATLLPLYHQAIQAHIDGKNREQYREAVRKLKKLRTLYKKLKRVDEWEQFLELLLARTKRLRAFHEECKRGKLIDA